MANRRRNFRRRFSYVLEKQNKYFKIAFIVLGIAIVFFATLFGYKAYSNSVKKNELLSQKEESKNEMDSIFQRADDAVSSVDDYKTDTIIRFSIAGLIDPTNLEKLITEDNIKTKEADPFEEEEETTNDNFNSLQNVEEYLNNSDFTIANYKITSSRNELLEDQVKSVGVNVLNLADNSDEKIDSFSKAMGEKNMQTIGNTYEKEGSSGRVNIVEKKGISIAFIGYTSNGTSSKNAYSEENAKQDLEYAKDNAEVIVVMMNWKNTQDEPTKTQKEQAQFLADNGANLIIGNNQNNVQNMEIIKGKDDKDCFVAYSLGNLLSSTNTEKNKSGLILQVQMLVDKDGNTAINRVDYNSTYILKEASKINTVNLKNEILQYEENESKNSENETNSIGKSAVETENLNGIEISKEIYNKMKTALARIEKIIKGE